MQSSTRLATVVLLLLAILVTGLAPASGSWSCPDGTGCVFTAGQGFHCVGDECALACCETPKPARGCGRCDHGALPGIGHAAGPQERTVGEADHCLYRGSPQIQPAMAPAFAAPDLQWHVAAVLPPPVAVPLALGQLARCVPIRGSPPTLRVSPASSPRAPPGADCA